MSVFECNVCENNSCELDVDADIQPIDCAVNAKLLTAEWKEVTIICCPACFIMFDINKGTCPSCGNIL